MEYIVSLDGHLEVLSSNDKSRDELLQKKESTESLINEGSNLIGEETIMSYEREFVPAKDKEDFAYLESHGKNDGQTFGIATRSENYNSILTERDEILSQKTLVSDQKEESHKEESKSTVSQIGDEIVLGLRKTELIERNGQRIEGKLLNIVKIEVLEGNQVINERLKYWLKVFKQEE